LETKIGEVEKETDGYSNQPKLDPRIKERLTKELDDIVEEIKALEHYSRVNFTGFMKVLSIDMTVLTKDCQEARQIVLRTSCVSLTYRHSRYTVRPLLTVRLRALPFNSEDYSILLQRCELRL
jgi:SPX domain protein involved in polyphosphate accumulation